MWWVNGDDRARRRVALSFGLVMGASSAMNNLFVTFYLEMFANIVQLDPSAFYSGQIIFMVWNASNDALFGWMSDSLDLGNIIKGIFFWQSSKGDKRHLVAQSPKEATIRRRLLVIRYGGLLWAVAFVLVWLPPVGSGWWTSFIHFTFVLCFYDGMLTLVEVNHSALLADLSVSGSERARMNAYSAMCAGAGSLSSFFGYWCWDRSGKGMLFSFQIMAVLLSGLCAAIFYFASIGMEPEPSDRHAGYESVPRGSNDPSCSACGPGTSLDAEQGPGVVADDGRRKPLERRSSFSLPLQEGVPSLVPLIVQLLSQKNFCVFQALYFVQAFDCTFGKNHFSIFLDGLAGSSFSPQFLGSVVSASFILPWVSTVALTSLVQTRGLFAVLGGILLTRIAWCTFSMLYTGQVDLSPGFSVLFILSNRVLSEAVCRICPLVMTDLVDEDRYLHKRSSSVSATIIGASTFFGKGSQSLAPMLGYYILSDVLKTDNVLVQEESHDAHSALGAWSPAQQSHMFSLVILIPLVCVSLQGVLWRSYSLKGSYLKQVKEYVSRVHIDNNLAVDSV